MPRHYANRPIPAEAAEKYATRYTVDESGCWITDFALGPNGYATANWRVEGQSWSTGVHRAAWTHHNGPIPDGMTVDHTCWTRACVNPAHLRLLTNAQNAARRDGYDFPLDGRCGNGHDASFRKMVKWGKVPAQSMCSQCLQDKNDRNTTLARLETVYGIRLTKRQQEMVDEFMPRRDRNAA